MSKNKVCLIMAGGSGERFWPLSRQSRPKQLLTLTHPRLNLLEETVARIEPLISADHAYIATSRQLYETIRAGGAGVPVENVWAEPCKRNTAGCLAYATARLMARYGKSADDLTVAVLSADHAIPDHDGFLKAVDRALETAAQADCLVVMGARPTRPESGYGYIEIPETDPLLAGDAVSPVYRVERFREKPSRETAKDFIATGRFYWNTGMFFWTLPRFMTELEAASPAHAAAIPAMATAMAAGDEGEVDAIFASLENISIDYALMEKARQVAMVPADFGWDDIGAWDALDRSRSSDAAGNVLVGDPVVIDSRNCIVYNASGSEKTAVALVGVDHLVVVVTDDGVLVVPKDRAQDVREAVSLLKARKATQV